MTYFASSRLGVLGLLIAFPFIVAAFAARAAAKEFRTEFGALRTDFMPAVRYVLTGDPDTTVAGHAGSKAASFAERVRYVFRTYAMDRLIALVLLIAMPILAVIYAARILIEEDYFADIWEGVVECSKAVVNGDNLVR